MNYSLQELMHAGFQGERPVSAMARTVGFPTAIAAVLFVQGKLDGLVGHGCEAAFRDGDL
jgi:saccharopine dehydrogenase-like NADP-dependent oxidoreductase